MRRRTNSKAHQILYPGDKLENEMGGACSAFGKRRGVYRVLVRKLRERDR